MGGKIMLMIGIVQSLVQICECILKIYFILKEHKLNRINKIEYHNEKTLTKCIDVRFHFKVTEHTTQHKS